MWDINKIRAVYKGWGIDLSDAAAIQESVRQAEQERLGLGVEYSDERVRQSTVHTREDLMLVVSHVGKIEREIHTLVGWVAVIGWLTIFAFLTGVVILLKANAWWPF